MTQRGDDGLEPLTAGDEIAAGYHVVGHLRRGEDLDVYDVWSDERACRCIGKTVRPDRLTTPGARSRLLREGRLLLRLTHPHIVRAYEVLTTPHPLLILETLPGETLAHLIDRHPRGLRAPDVAQLGLQLCSAIGYLHHQGMLHLDLKPSNVVASYGLAKVLDLSLARAPGRYRGGSGTTGYMAPEQITGGEYGPWTDVWGLGAVLYEAASGQPACEGDDEATDGSAVSDSDISLAVCQPGPIRRTRRMPTALATAIDGALSAEPDQRPTVEELTRMLSAVTAPMASMAQDVKAAKAAKSAKVAKGAKAAEGVDGRCSG